MARIAGAGARLPARSGAPRAAVRRERPRGAARVRRDELGIASCEAWDLAYASEKLRAKRYAFSDQEVKQYFPEDAVLAGLFRVVETLYGVKIAPAQAPVWHQDVRFFDIRDAPASWSASSTSTSTRATPSAAAPGWTTRSRRRRKGGALQTPVAYLTCNFSRPGRRQAGAVHARRRDHAVPRVRPRPAPPADARRGPRRLGHQRRGVGRGRAAQPVHGELLLGVGRAART